MALLINATKLVFFIKWPLMILFAGGGLALAFVPFQDRPLETWLMAFLKSIYAPTIYLYRKKIQKNWLEIDLTKKLKSDEEEEVVVPQKQEEKVREFIGSLPSVGREEFKEEIGGDIIDLEEVKEEISEKKTEDKVIETVTEEKSDNNPEGKKIPEVTTKVNLDLKKEKLGATGRVVFGAIPMPDIPELPNLMVGMVLDKNDKIVEGAIVEIQDKEGNPSRVLKTNQLGQFKTLTQLSDGKYLVVTEKEGLEFDRVEIVLNGEIVQPIKILAK